MILIRCLMENSSRSQLTGTVEHWLRIGQHSWRTGTRTVIKPRVIFHMKGVIRVKRKFQRRLFFYYYCSTDHSTEDAWNVIYLFQFLFSFCPWEFYLLHLIFLRFSTRRLLLYFIFCLFVYIFTFHPLYPLFSFLPPHVATTNLFSNS